MVRQDELPPHLREDFAYEPHASIETARELERLGFVTILRTWRDPLGDAYALYDLTKKGKEYFDRYMDCPIHMEVAEAAGNIATDEFVVALVRKLLERKGPERTYVEDILNDVPHQLHALTNEDWVRLLGDPYEEVRLAAIRALGHVRLGTNPTWVGEESDGDPSCGCAAI